jgi:hypothetical protein
MRYVRLMAASVASVLSLVSVVAMAQGQGAAATTAGEQSSFKGVVVSISPAALTVKGEFEESAAATGSTATSSAAKARARTMHFLIKGAKVTRGGWRAAELTDIEKGATVTVTFPQPAQRRGRFVATQIDLAEAVSVEKRPILGEAGKLLFGDDFARSEMPPKWRLGKGFWEIRDGVVVAAENPADNHGAYAYAEPRFVYKDIVAEFSFKFDGSRSCHFMMEDSTYKLAHAGHIIRATITPTTANLNDSKFGSMKNEIYEKMKDPQTSPSEKKRLQESIKDKSVTFKIALDAEKWHEARVEVVGDEMLLSIDYRPVAYLKSEGVDHPTKNMVGFTVAGKSMQLDNVKVYAATPRSDWAKDRESVQATLQKL